MKSRSRLCAVEHVSAWSAPHPSSATHDRGARRHRRGSTTRGRICPRTRARETRSQLSALGTAFCCRSVPTETGGCHRRPVPRTCPRARWVAASAVRSVAATRGAAAAWTAVRSHAHVALYMFQIQSTHCHSISPGNRFPAQLQYALASSIPRYVTGSFPAPALGTGMFLFDQSQFLSQWYFCTRAICERVAGSKAGVSAVRRVFLVPRSSAPKVRAQS